MAEESLTGLKIKDTYEGLLHVDDGGLSTNSGAAAVKKVYDGVGKSTCLEIAKDYLKVIGDGRFESALGDPALVIEAVNGAVGIGTGNVVSSAKLDVRGGYIALDSNNSGTRGWITQGGNGNGIGLAGGGNAGGVVADLYVNQIGKVGIGTETPGSMLEIKGDGSTKWGGIEIDTNGDGGSGFIDQGVDGRGIGLRGESVQNGAEVCNLYVANDGKVGIGTETPQKKLHIVGQMRYEHGTPAVGQVLTCTNTNGNVEWQDSSGGDIYDEIKIIPPDGIFVRPEWSTNVEIPKGYKATHVTLYATGTDSSRLRCEIYEGKITNDGHVLVATADTNTSPGSGIAKAFTTQATSTSVNFLHFVLKDRNTGGGKMAGASIRIQKV